MKTSAKKSAIVIFIIAQVLFCFKNKATNYYADPSSAGSMTNTGSFASPWSTLSAIFAANKVFLAGDTIFLRNGNHGTVSVKGINSGYVVIMPQVGHNPIVPRFRIPATSSTPAAYWKLYKLFIQSEATASITPIDADYTLVELGGASSNITISSCTITSNLNTTGWTRDDWRTRCNSGISSRGKLNSNHIIEKNLIKNLQFAFSWGASHAIIKENTIENFTNDAVRMNGSFNVFEKNVVADLIKTYTGIENHDDLFQGFIQLASNGGGPGQDTLKNDIIRNNIFINTRDTTPTFRGTAQGIGCFDGPFVNWTVENNIIMVDHWHGISFYGATNCKIINNTVIDPYKYTTVDPFDNNSTNTGPAWIFIGKKTTGPSSQNNEIRNNLVHNVVTLQTPTVGIQTNNIILSSIPNFSNYFVNVANLSQPGNFDLHLKSGCLAIDSGTSTNAPSTDFDGVARPQGTGFDIGAYEFVVGNPTSISENVSINDDLLAYPNPFNNEISIKSKTDLEVGSKIQLYNMSGQLVKEYTNNYVTNIIKIDLSSEEPKGMYLIKLINNAGNEIRTIKVIKN